MNKLAEKLKKTASNKTYNNLSIMEREKYQSLLSCAESGAAGGEFWFETTEIIYPNLRKLMESEGFKFEFGELLPIRIRWDA